MQVDNWEKIRGLSEDLNTKSKTKWERRRKEVGNNKGEVKRGQEIWGIKGFKEQKTQLRQTQNLPWPISNTLG
jgi:hypothetical protein